MYIILDRYCNHILRTSGIQCGDAEYAMPPMEFPTGALSHCGVTLSYLPKNRLHVGFNGRDRSDVEVLDQEVENVRSDESRQ